MILNNYPKPSSLRSTLFCAALASILAATCAAPLAAQTSSAPQEPAQKDEKKDPQSAAPKPAPSEGFKLGVYEGSSEIEFGVRWVSNTAGNAQMYKSMVNLKEGARLLRSSLSLRSSYGSGGLFDRLDFSLDNCCTDPYASARLSIGRADLYELRADSRSFSYYNYIPTFANPLLDNTQFFNQHSLDVTLRTTDIEFKLFPNRKIRPYFGYSRSSQFGPGYSTYSLTGNEFMTQTNMLYLANEYRGGLQFNLSRFVLSVEQGVRTLKNDSAAAHPEDSTGNLQYPFLGRTITLNSLDRGYHDRTSMPIFKAVGTALPFAMLKLSGRYVYSSADTQSDLAEIRSGSLVSLDDRLFYNSALDSFSTQAKRPNSNGAFSAEFSPFSRLTLIDKFDFRRSHVTGSGLLRSIYLQSKPLGSPSYPPTDKKIEQLVNTYLLYDQTGNLAEAELFLTRGLSAHGGYRYSSTDATLRDGEGDEADSRQATLRRDTAIAGLAFRSGRWLRLSLDYEHNSSDQGLTRSDLYNYDQAKLDWQLGSWKNISANGCVAFLRNRNPQSDIDWKSHNRNYSVAVNYEPSERFSLNLDYSYSNIFSDMAILLPQTLELSRSAFDERDHGIGAGMGIGMGRGARLDFGYRGILNSGSYPLNYHQPYANLSIPLADRFAFKTYWQYFGYNEKGSSLQDHRTHLVTFSLAYAY